MMYEAIRPQLLIHDTRLVTVIWSADRVASIMDVHRDHIATTQLITYNPNCTQIATWANLACLICLCAVQSDD